MKAFSVRRITRPAKRPFRVGVLTFQDPILLCFLLYLLLMRDYSGFLRLSLLASFVHEAGHVLVYCLFYRAMPQIRVSATGLCMQMPRGICASSAQLVLLALAGPCANFFAASICLLVLQTQVRLAVLAFFSANVLLGLFNLVPIAPLDGSVVFAFLQDIFHEKLPFWRK